MPISEIQLDRLFQTAFDTFAAEARQMLEKKLHEQTICGTLAQHLWDLAREQGLEGYRTDVEYDKMHGEIKTILDDQGMVIKIRCDLLLHSRGEIPNEDNLIAVEMKKSSRPKKEREADRVRLRALTKPRLEVDVLPTQGVIPKHVCGYRLGAYIILDVRGKKIDIEYFKNGQCCDRKVVELGS